LWRDFVIFFISALHFSINQYTNLLNLTKFVSQHLIATHGHFHRHQFLTANYFFIRPVLSYLAVATATWQHWPDRSLKSSSASLSDRRSSSRWSWFSQQLLPWPSVGVFFWLVGVETNSVFANVLRCILISKKAIIAIKALNKTNKKV
jgi:hypothetical protein